MLPLINPSSFGGKPNKELDPSCAGIVLRMRKRDETYGTPENVELKLHALFVSMAMKGGSASERNRSNAVVAAGWGHAGNRDSRRSRQQIRGFSRLPESMCMVGYSREASDDRGI